MVGVSLTLPAVSFKSCQTFGIALIFAGLGLTAPNQRALRPPCPLTPLRFSIPTLTGERSPASFL